MKLDLLAIVSLYCSVLAGDARSKEINKAKKATVAGADLLEGGMHERRQLLEYLLLLVRQCGLLAHLKGGDAKLAVDM